MAIFTPRGLKIRLPFDYTFALIARLYPKIDAFKVLKTTEGLESIPGMLAFIVGVTSFYLRLDPYMIGLYVLIASVAGTIITTFGIFVIPGLPKLGTFYSYISGFYILIAVLVVYGFVSVGWQGVAAFFIGKIIAEIIKWGAEFWNTNRIHSKIGVPLTGSEVNFLNAYRLHAKEVGKSTEIDVSDEELKEENWKEVFEDLATKWPEVVRRFTVS